MAYLIGRVGHQSALPGSQIHGIVAESDGGGKGCLQPDLLPAAAGTYALLLRLHKERTLEVGRLGTVAFTPGYYLYLGSAMNGLARRAGRHLTRGKRLHWHIDTLTEAAEPVGLWWTEGTKRMECLWAQNALSAPGSRAPAQGFGASDCRCASHLVLLPGGTSPSAHTATVPATLEGRHRPRHRAPTCRQGWNPRP